MIFKKKLWQGATYTSVFLLALSIMGGSVMENYRDYVDTAFNTKSTKVVTEEGKLYDKFKPNDKYLNSDGTGNSKALIKDAIDLGRRAGAEGCVLLKNDKETLPLAEKSKVTLLGMRSEITLVGAGMGVMAQGSMITLADGLSATTTNFQDPDHVATYYNRSPYGGGKNKTITAGYETFDNFNLSDFGGSAGFEVNPTMGPLYRQYNATLDTETAKNALTNNDSVADPSTTTYQPYEPTVEQLKSFNPTFQDSFANYKDAAIVVVGRPSNESNDYWKGDMNDSVAKEPFQLSAAERETIKMATDNFSKVIVLVNSASPMDIEELKDNDKIGAIMYIGQPGTYGLLGVAQVIAGKMSPSGHLADTFSSNQMNAPAMVNFGDYTYSNADKMTRTSSIGGTNTSKKYVIEAEGLYTGYKYYETRYDDCVEKQGNASGSAGVYAEGNTSWKYDDEVSYPFGYGKSYTEFEQEIIGSPVENHSVSSHEWTLEFTVKVTNKGNKYSGKDVVQIFGQAPYTKGGLEKSAIQLLGFAKTGEIAPGKDETVKVTVDLQNLASYDQKHDNGDGTKGTYVFDKGNHYFALGNGAHEALNNILKARNFDVEGDSKDVYTLAVSDYDDKTFAYSKNGYEVHNQLDYSDWNYYNNETTVTYLSRSDWNGTWPKEYKDLKASDTLVQDLNGVGTNYYQYNADSKLKEGESVVWGQNNNMNLASMVGASWDDDRWQKVIDQVTLSEAVQMVMYGGPNLGGAESIGWTYDDYLTENSGSGVTLDLKSTKDKSAPWAIKETDNNAAWKGGVFPNAPTTACSYNQDMWYEIGNFVGTEGLFTGITLLWGPGLNTHRCSYNGRTGEYYSEDGVLAGIVAMDYAIGAIDNGLIASPKHFAFNDQETNRAGVSPYMTEQRARETELRAYQIAIEATKYDKLRGKDCGMRGLMTSFSKIGGVEVTCSYGLMTEILQNEWGFHGYAVTDIYDDTDLFAAVAASGVTCYDLRGNSSNKNTGVANRMFTNQAQGYEHSVETYSKDLVLQQRMKKAVKNLVWVMAQSSYMNRFNASSKSVSVETSWRIMYKTLIGVFSVTTAAFAVLYVVSFMKNKEAK